MKYIGKFSNRNNELIEVNIITNGITVPEQEITLGETPVIISQTSDDGIFSPIKSRSCTISIVTQDIYDDMYTPESHGTKVIVNNITKGVCLFYGFLTPCEYNQPYKYLNTVELEAVDALSTLKDFKYTSLTGQRINRIKTLLNHALVTEAGYQNVYIPFMGNKTHEQYNLTGDNKYPTNLEYLSDEMFKDNDNKYITWYEIVEEICKFFGFTAVPYGEDVYFIDYKIVNFIGNKEYAGESYDTTFKTYYNIVNSQPYYINQTLMPLTMDDYAGDEQNIEIDEVYNKITVKADIEKIEDDDIYVDIEDDAENAALIRTKQDTMAVYDTTNSWIGNIMPSWQAPLKESYTVYNRLFYPTAVQINNKQTSKYWQCYANTNVWDETIFAIPVMHAKFSNHFTNYISIDEMPSYTTRLSRYEYQYCTLVQNFGWKNGTAPSAKVDWKTNIVFHTGIEAWYRYYHDINTGEDSSEGTRRIRVIDKQIEYPGSNDIWSLWWNMYVNELMCQPVLEYKGKDYVGLTPMTSNDIVYICITGDLLYQKTGQMSNDYVDIWYSNSNYKDYITTTLADAGYNSSNDEVLIGSRLVNTQDYNLGWPCLKCVLNIGDKWWNGTYWQDSYSEFWINFHKENVAGDVEKLVMYDWNSMVVNHDYTSGINEDCYAIPIHNYDNIYGKVNMKIFNPYVHLYGVTAADNSDFMSYDYYNNTAYIRINIDKCIPAVYMKDFGISVVHIKDYATRNETWITHREKKNDDDVIYSNTISSNNVLEFSELDLKINTYNDKQPLAESYVFVDTGSGYAFLSNSNNSFKDNVNNRVGIEENLLVQQYKDHYSAPKLIYNCQVHNYFAPWYCISPSAVGNKRMVIDEQEYDVKADINTLKLIEY